MRDLQKKLYNLGIAYVCVCVCVCAVIERWREVCVGVVLCNGRGDKSICMELKVLVRLKKAAHACHGGRISRHRGDVKVLEKNLSVRTHKSVAMY